MPRVPAVDGFRAYAILGVIAIHLIGLSGALEGAEGTPFAIATWGVLGNVIDAFFIISGFVLFLPVVVRGGELGGRGRYALGRVARLVPAYWLSIVVLLVLIAAAPPAAGPFVGPEAFPGAAEVLAHLAALQMPALLVDAEFAIGFGLNPPLWMISVIVGFYVVFPFVAQAYYRHPLLGLAAAALISFAWREAAIRFTGAFASLTAGDEPGWVTQVIATDQLPGWAFSFALGMTGAWGYVRLLERRTAADLVRPAAAVAACALLACVACAYLYGLEAAEANAPFSGSLARSSPLLTLGYAAARGLLMAGIALGPLWLQRPFANRLTARLAELSYGAYLIHFVVAAYVGALLLGLPTDGEPAAVLAWFSVVVPLSLGYAYLSLRLVERPGRRWARRYSPALPGRVAA